jgi:hypothetical protein
VTLPQPELGLVVHYSYLFLTRTRNIGDSGKERPCLIAAVFEDKDDPPKTGVLYLPITHTQPGPEEAAIEIPPNIRHGAGLDGSRQWLLISQGNKDTWPEDVSHRPNRPGVFHYGYLPPAFFKQVQLEFQKLYVSAKFNIQLR